ncbi:hypothetical protein CHU98_g7930 [Xylaria longipes]|nr:hypothetical protein CHU98_g7930 [Xylaria longipes]
MGRLRFPLRMAPGLSWSSSPSFSLSFSSALMRYFPSSLSCSSATAARLERVGREIQGHWSELQQDQSQNQDPAPRARGRVDERTGPDAAAVD